jgi:sporulation protein YlmC with PRC-barrel domain
MRLSDLLGTEVRTEAGASLGRVHDVRGRLSDRGLRVVGLVVGGQAVLERLGIGAPGALERVRGGDVVPWRHVLRADRRGIVVDDRWTADD